MTDVVDIAAEGFTLHWANPYTNAAPNDRLVILEVVLSATTNYYWIALDLLDCSLEPQNAHKIQLRTLLRFFYNGATTTYGTATGLATSPAIDILLPRLHRRLSGLAVALLLLGEDLTTPLPRADPNRNDLWKIPNAQALEILVTAILTSLPKDANLGTLKAKMLLTNIVKNQRDDGRPGIGLPVVIFVCMTDRIVACSGDQWGVSMAAFNRISRARRRDRFGNTQWTTMLDYAGTRVQQRFDYVTAWFRNKDKEFGGRAQKCKLDPREYNDLVECMYKAQPDGPPYAADELGGEGLDRKFGYEHLSESGRSFYGAGNKMFNEMSRCWKCRFIFHYRTRRPGTANEGLDGLEAENPKDTSWICNPPLVCAEDLCHHRCATIGNRHASLKPTQELVFKPFPNAQ